jgi:hypothetical protein
MTEQLQQPNKLLSEVHVYKKEVQSQNAFADLKAWLASIDPRLGECIKEKKFVLPLAQISNMTLAVNVSPMGMKKFTFGFDVKF